MAISGSLRSILESIEKGHGLVSQLVRGEDAGQPKDRLTLESIQRTLEHVDKLSIALSQVMDRINNGRGVVGAMLSDQTDGKQFLDNLEQTAARIRRTSARLDTLIARFDKANGILPQLMENKDFSDDVIPNIRQSSHDLKDILQKINSSQGTAGLIVNDPTLYNRLTGFMDNGGGWGLRFINGFYDLTHPFARPVAKCWRAAGDADGVASGRVQRAAGHSVSGDPRHNCAGAERREFIFIKVTRTPDETQSGCRRCLRYVSSIRGLRYR